jgi:ABC-type transporter MlaC component
MRRTLILSAFVLAISGPIASADEADAKRVVQNLGEQAVAANKIEDKGERRRSLLDAATPAVDFKTIGSGVLAHAGVKVPSSREAEVLEGVIAYVSNQVINEIDRIRPEEAKLGEAKPKSEDEVRVPMLLAGVKDRIDADWVVKKTAEGWRVTDVMVSGNSLTAHFGGTLARRTRGEVDQLIEFLRAEQQRVRTASLQ